jgi:hypothetical protein
MMRSEESIFRHFAAEYIIEFETVSKIGGDDLWKKHTSKISWDCLFKIYMI